MAYFEELNNSLNAVLQKILDNQDLCKMIYYSDIPSNHSDIDTSILITEKYLNPMSKIPEANSDQKSIMNVHYLKAQKGKTNKGSVHEILALDIICHLDNQMVKGGNLLLMMCSEVEGTFDSKIIEDISPYKLQFAGFNEIYPADFFSGYRILFDVTHHLEGVTTVE